LNTCVQRWRCAPTGAPEVTPPGHLLQNHPPQQPLPQLPHFQPPPSRPRPGLRWRRGPQRQRPPLQWVSVQPWLWLRLRL